MGVGCSVAAVAIVVFVREGSFVEDWESLVGRDGCLPVLRCCGWYVKREGSSNGSCACFPSLDVFCRQRFVVA